MTGADLFWLPRRLQVASLNVHDGRDGPIWRSFLAVAHYSFE